MLTRRIRAKAERILDSLNVGFYRPGRTKVLLLNYTAHQDNYGCRATSKGLLKLIRQTYPSAAIVRRSIDFALSPDDFDLHTSPDGWDTYLENADRSSAFNGFSRADVIILNGEGTMHEWPDMRRRPEPYLRLLDVYAASRIFHKPVMAVNQTVHYWSDEFADWVTAAYGVCDYVSVREPQSLQRLQSLGLANAQLVPDAAFLTEASSPQLTRAFMAKRGIAEGFVALFPGNNVGDAPIEKLQDLVVQIRKNHNCQVVLFAPSGVELDKAPDLVAHLGAPVIGIEASPETVIGMLSSASIVLSGRFHPCILAALAKTPLVPFKTVADRSESLMELLEYPLPVLDYQEISNGDVLDAVQEVTRRRDELVGILNVRVPELRITAQAGYPNLLDSQ